VNGGCWRRIGDVRAARVDEDFIDDAISYLVERVIKPPGRWVLEQVGEPCPTEIASLVTGLAFWAFVVFLVFALVLGW
jgi:hypothetical protein